jgi:hypothetical protein
MKVENGEDSAFISEAADRLTPFEGPVKFNESLPDTRTKSRL